MRRIGLVVLAGVLVAAQVAVFGLVPERASAYTAHPPILIDGDAAFTPANGVTRGSGTAVDPFVIEGWDINASTADGIRITNTNAHFVVQDVAAHSGAPLDDGIVLYNTTNGIVQRSVVTGNRFGIFLVDTIDTVIAANRVTDGSRGIVTAGAWDLEVRDNVLSSMEGSCIDIGGARNITVAGNSGRGCRDGVDVSATSVAVHGNAFANSLFGGVSVYMSSTVSVTNNTLTGNLYGVWLVYNSTSSDIAVAGNDIVNNTYGANFEWHSTTGPVAFRDNLVADNRYGAYLNGTTDVHVVHNRFVNNTVQAFDALGAENVWDDGCPGGGNYWSDYTGQDATDCTSGLPGTDGLGDTAYVIDADSRDNYPLMEPGTPPTNTAPSAAVLSPAGGEDWTGGVAKILLWTATDAEDPPSALSADLAYSPDGGGTWIPIALGLPGVRSHDWTVPSIDTSAAEVRVCETDTGGLSGCAVSPPFTIDSTPPRVASTEPASGSAAVPSNAVLRVHFTERMNETLGSLTLTPSVQGAPSWDPGRQTLSFSPSAPWTACTNYTLTVAGFRDASDPGNRMAGAHEATFRTACPGPTPQAPVAKVVVRDRVQVGEPVTLDGSLSTGNITTYRWTITDDQGRTVGTLEGRTVTYEFPREGGYAVTLRVTDASTGLSGEDRAEVAVVGALNVWPIVLLVTALLAVALIATTEIGAVPVLTFLLAAVNRRKPEEDSVGRGMVLGYIIGNPGDTYTDIKKNLGMNNGPLSWHLMKMEKEGLVKSRTEGTHKCYYPAGMPLPAENGGELHAIERRLLETVRADPGQAVGALAEELGVSRQLALYHARKLSRSGLLTLERRGLHLRIYAAAKRGASAA